MSVPHLSNAFETPLHVPLGYGPDPVGESLHHPVGVGGLVGIPLPHLVLMGVAPLYRRPEWVALHPSSSGRFHFQRTPCSFTRLD